MLSYGAKAPALFLLACFFQSTLVEGDEPWVRLPPAGSTLGPMTVQQPVPRSAPPGADVSQPIHRAPTIQELSRRLQQTEAELAILRQRTDPQASQAGGQVMLVSMQPGTSAQGAAPMDVEGRIALLEQNFTELAGRMPAIRLSGFFHYDTGFFSQDAASRSTLGDIQNGSGFRRTRLQGLGKLTETTNFSIEMDFAFAGRPSFMDVWGEQTDLRFGRLRVGQFRLPVTMTSWTSIRHLEFLERSAPFIAFDPFRRVGIMNYDLVNNGRTMWAASIYGTEWTFWNGTATQYSSEGNDNRFGTALGDNGGIGFTGRISHLLYYDEPTNGRYLLHVGGGYNFAQIGGNGVGAAGTVGGQTYRATTIPEFFVGDQGGGGSTFAGTPNVLDTGRFLAHNYQLLHAELAGNWGSAHFQSEWMGTAVAQFGGPLVFYQGAYAQAGYFLTGESAGYNKEFGALDYNCKPFSNFFGIGRRRGICGWGAWEVAARWSYLDLQTNRINPANYQGVAAGGFTGSLPAGPSTSTPNPGILNESTLALNWYWNSFTRVQFNWIHNMLDSQFRGFSAMDLYTTRFQIEF